MGTDALEKKRMKAKKYLQTRGLLATSQQSEFVYTNSAGMTIEPPKWLSPKRNNNVVSPLRRVVKSA